MKLKKQKEMEQVLGQQVCEKKTTFQLREVYYTCLNLLLVMTHDGYFYCTYELLFGEHYPPKLVGEKCPACVILDFFYQEELEEINYSRVKQILFYNQLFIYVEMSKEKDPRVNDLFSTEYEYKFNYFRTGYSFSILLKYCNKLN